MKNIVVMEDAVKKFNRNIAVIRLEEAVLGRGERKSRKRFQMHEGVLSCQEDNGIFSGF